MINPAEVAALRIALSQARETLSAFQAEVTDYQDAARDGMADSISRLNWAILVEDEMAQKCESLVAALAAALLPVRTRIRRLEALATGGGGKGEESTARLRAEELRATYGLTRRQAASPAGAVVALLGAAA